MAFNLFELASLLTTLIVGRRAEYTAQPVSADRPSGTVGAALVNSPRAYVVVDVREDLAHRTARIKIDTLDLTANHTLTIDSNAVVYNPNGAGNTTAQEALEGWKNAINASSAVNTIITASTEDTDNDGTVDTLVIKGDTDADFTIDATVGGSGVLDAQADAVSCEVEVYVQMDGIDGWRLAANGKLGTISKLEGYVDRADSANVKRMYLRCITTGVMGDGAGVINRPARLSVGRSLKEIA